MSFELIAILIVAMVVSAVVAERITKHMLEGEIFTKVRTIVIDWPIVGNLATCYWCLSQWVSWAVLPVWLFILQFPLDWDVTTFSVVFLGGFAVHYFASILHAIDPYGN